jgi:hypothetical protein
MLARLNATSHKIVDAFAGKYSTEELRALNAELYPGAPDGRGRPSSVAAHVNRWYYSLPPGERRRTIYSLASAYLNTGGPGARSHVTAILTELDQIDRTLGD